MSNYVPHSKQEVDEMLKKIGVSSVDALYEFKSDAKIDLPNGKSQIEVERFFEALGSENKVYHTVLRGAGAYKHYCPPAVRSLISRSEFLTAYTPYQAELNQGELQAAFEYQTMICELTGMDISNASVYDGNTAVADAIVMSISRKKHKVLISQAISAQTIELVKTYNHFLSDVELIFVPLDGYKTDMKKLKELATDDVAAIVMQQPNKFGTIEDCEAVGAIAAEKKCEFVMSSNPLALGLLKSPRECGATIAVGEGQALGLPLSAGGPYLGYLATIQANMRKIPGRIVGQSVDSRGNTAYVLTLQAREQHIRREKASSSICSNQALCALQASMFMAAYGKGGFKTIGKVSLSNAHYLAGELEKLGLTVQNNGEFFHEFVTKTNGKTDAINAALDKAGILGGLKLSDDEILWCTTDILTKEDLDTVVKIVKEVL